MAVHPCPARPRLHSHAANSAYVGLVTPCFGLNALTFLPSVHWFYNKPDGHWWGGWPPPACSGTSSTERPPLSESPATIANDAIVAFAGDVVFVIKNKHRFSRLAPSQPTTPLSDCGIRENTRGDSRQPVTPRFTQPSRGVKLCAARDNCPPQGCTLLPHSTARQRRGRFRFAPVRQSG